MLPLGQALAYGGLGRYVAVHIEDVAGVSQVAVFLVTTFERLEVAIQGNGGSVASTPSSISCGASCAADFETGSEVTLDASPDPGAKLQSWSILELRLGCELSRHGVGTAHGHGHVRALAARRAGRTDLLERHGDEPDGDLDRAVGRGHRTTSWSGPRGRRRGRRSPPWLERPSATQGSPQARRTATEFSP